MTVQADSIYAVPQRDRRQKAAVARTLAADRAHRPRRRAAPREDADCRSGSTTGSSFAWVARRVTPEVAASVKALNIKGIYFQKEFQRFYPDNEIAAQVLGYVGAGRQRPRRPGAEFDAAAARRPGPHVHRHGCAPPRAGLERARAGAGPESGAHHRREHPVHGRARSRSRDGADACGQRHRCRAGRAHRPDSRSRHPAHVQSQPVSPHHAGAAEEPRGQRRLRARLDVQAGHLLRRARPARDLRPTT